MGRPQGLGRESNADKLLKHLRALAEERGDEGVTISRDEAASIIGREVGDLWPLLLYAVDNGTFRTVGKGAARRLGLGTGRKKPQRRPPLRSRAEIDEPLQRIVPAHSVAPPKTCGVRSVFDLAAAA